MKCMKMKINPFYLLMFNMHTNEAWVEGKPIDDKRMRLKAIYRVLDQHSVLLRNVEVEHDWFTFGLEQIAYETASLGFKFTPLTKPGETLFPTGVLRFKG